MLEEDRQIFSDDTLYLPDLARERMYIENCVFRNCLICGPAVIVAQGTTRFQAPTHIDQEESEAAIAPESYAWVRDEGVAAIGAIPVIDCEFESSCRYRRIGWVGGKNWVAKFQEAIEFGRWEEEMDF